MAQCDVDVVKRNRNKMENIQRIEDHEMWLSEQQGRKDTENDA